MSPFLQHPGRYRCLRDIQLGVGDTHSHRAGMSAGSATEMANTGKKEFLAPSLELGRRTVEAESQTHLILLLQSRNLPEDSVEREFRGSLLSCPDGWGASFSVLGHIRFSNGLAQGTSRSPRAMGASSDVPQGRTPLPAAYEPQGPVRLLFPQARIRTRAGHRDQHVHPWTEPPPARRREVALREC